MSHEAPVEALASARSGSEICSRGADIRRQENRQSVLGLLCWSTVLIAPTTVVLTPEAHARTMVEQSEPIALNDALSRPTISRNVTTSDVGRFPMHAVKNTVLKSHGRPPWCGHTLRRVRGDLRLFSGMERTGCPSLMRLWSASLVRGRFHASKNHM